MSENEAEPHLSPFELDSLRLGRLPVERARVAASHLDVCPTCGALEARLRAHQQHFADEVLPRTRPLLRQRAERQAGIAAWRRWLLIGAVPLAAAAALLVLRVRSGSEDIGYQAEKGGSSLRVVGQHQGRPFAVASGDALVAGDAIRFVVTSRHSFLMIASVDGRGQTKVYVPYEGAESVAVSPGRMLELPAGGSIALDAAPGPERIFALFSRRPLPAAPVLAALQELSARGAAAIRSTDRLEIVSAEEQLSVLFEKAER
jgi:hypothetical protein